MYVYIIICTHVYIYVYIHMTYIHTYMHACMHACIHTYTRICTYIYVYIHAYMDMDIRIHMCLKILRVIHKKAGPQAQASSPNRGLRLSPGGSQDQEDRWDLSRQAARSTGAAQDRFRPPKTT